MINPKFNVIIARSLGTMLTNAGRSREMLESSLHILQRNLRLIKILGFWLVMPLRKVLMMFGFWIVVVVTT